MTSLQDVSKVAYGKPSRLGLLLALESYPASRICQKDLKSATGASPALVRQLFVELVQLGMLVPVASDDGMRKKFFERVEGPGWVWARQLAKLSSTGPSQAETLW